jgi:hypothetical protein
LINRTDVRHLLMQAADFMGDSDADNLAMLARICSAAQWVEAEALALRVAIRGLPEHHQAQLFRAMLKSTPFNVLCAQLPLVLHNALTSALWQPCAPAAGDASGREGGQLQLHMPDEQSGHTGSVSRCARLSSAACRSLAQHLPFQQSLASVDLSGHALADEHLTAILDALAHHAGLTRLCLASNRGGVVTVSTLAVALQSWPGLQSLDVSAHASMDDTQCSALVPSLHRLASLTQLALPQVHLTRSFVQAVGKLSGLQSLRMHSSWHDDLPAALAQLAHLRQLDLKHDKQDVHPDDVESVIKDLKPLAQALAAHGSIAWLDLAYTAFDVADFEFAAMPRLQHLALAGYCIDSTADNDNADQDGAAAARLTPGPAHRRGLLGLWHTARLTHLAFGGGDVERNMDLSAADALAAGAVKLPSRCSIVIAGDGLKSEVERALVSSCRKAQALTALQFPLSDNRQLLSQNHATSVATAAFLSGMRSLSLTVQTVGELPDTTGFAQVSSLVALTQLKLACSATAGDERSWNMGLVLEMCSEGAQSPMGPRAPVHTRSGSVIAGFRSARRSAAALENAHGACARV